MNSTSFELWRPPTNKGIYIYIHIWSLVTARLHLQASTCLHAYVYIVKCTCTFISRTVYGVTCSLPIQHTEYVVPCTCTRTVILYRYRLHIQSVPVYIVLTVNTGAIYRQYLYIVLSVYTGTDCIYGHYLNIQY